MSPPLVSVVLPTFNRERYVSEAVASVRQQDGVPWEVIVVDDGSTDGTGDVLRRLADPRVRVITRGGHGGNVAALRNAGILASRGRYVAFLDSDDRWLPDKLGRQMAALAENRHQRWCYTGFRFIDGRGRPLPPRGLGRVASGDIFRELLEVRLLTPTPTVVVDRALLHDVGGFDEALAQAEDFDLWLRCALCGPVCGVDDVLVEVRLHEGRSTTPEAERWVARVYAKTAASLADASLRRRCRRLGARRLVRYALHCARSGRRREAWQAVAGAAATPMGWGEAAAGLPRVMWRAIRGRRSRFDDPPSANTSLLFQLLLRRLRPHVIVDVGSCDGRHARRFKRLVPSTRVIALEADPENAAAMMGDRRNAAAEIETLHVAASDRDGRVSFFQGDRRCRATRGIGSLRPRAEADRRAAVVPVQTVRLDTLLAGRLSAGDRIALWIDVEGAAFEALDGAWGVLDRVDLIHVEVETQAFWRGQQLEPAVVRLMAGAGFRALARGPHELQHDVVFVHEETYARRRTFVRHALCVVRVVSVMTSVKWLERVAVRLWRAWLGEGRPGIR